MAVINTSTGVATVSIAGTVTVDGSGVTQPVSGTVSVGNFPATQAVSVATLPLPAGAAKDTTLTDGSQRVGGVVTVDGSAVTQPVSVSNFPATQPVSGSVSVSNFPATQPVSGSVSVSNFPATQPVSGPLTDVQLRASRVPVDGSAVTQPVSGTLDRIWSLDRELDSVDIGTPEVMQGSAPWRVDGSAVVQPVSGAFYQPVQPVSAGSLPLPAGAATDATAQAQLATLNEIAWQAILASERMAFS